MRRLHRNLMLDEVDQHRNEDCQSYEDCLERAAIAQWQSFSCENCDMYYSAGVYNIEPFVYKREPEAFPMGGSFSEIADFDDFSGEGAD